MVVSLCVFDTVLLEASWDWLQDVELRQLLDTAAITKAQQKKWFETLPQRKDYLIWGVLLDGRPAGATGIKNIMHNTGEYWGYIGDKNYWGQGFGSAMMQLTIAEAKSIQLKSLTLKVLPNNERAIQLYKKNGFVLTGADKAHQFMEKTI